MLDGVHAISRAGRASESESARARARARERERGNRRGISTTRQQQAGAVANIAAAAPPTAHSLGHP
eukprot:COSAG01_NODE_411_length_17360_cov_11.401852_24_plen_66_part_00